MLITVLSTRLRMLTLEAVVRFVSGERLCCPFLGFTLELAPDHGPLWLRVTGPDGAKAILRVELQLPTPGT